MTEKKKRGQRGPDKVQRTRTPKPEVKKTYTFRALPSDHKRILEQYGTVAKAWQALIEALPPPKPK